MMHGQTKIKFCSKLLASASIGKRAGRGKTTKIRNMMCVLWGICHTSQRRSSVYTTSR